MPERVVFACVHSAGRSQMAAGWFRALADPSMATAEAAGTQPGPQLHPNVVEVMREAGVDLSGRKPRLLDDVLAEQKPAMLITMGCGEQCPFVPGVARDDWPLPDPKGATLEQTRKIRDDIRSRVEALLDARGWRRK